MLAKNYYSSGGDLILPGKSVEFLEENLKEIKETVEEIADVLFKGNGHSLMSRMMLLESKVSESREEIEKRGVVIHDLKNRLIATELKYLQIEKKLDRGDGKVWNVITIVLSVGLSFLIQLYLK